MNAADYMTPQIRHGPERLKDGTWRWNVWAPRSESVKFVLYDDGKISDELPLESKGNGLFTSAPLHVSAGQRYGVRLGECSVRPDPLTRWQPEGVHWPSAVWFPDDYDWSDAEWKGRARADLVTYELHVGTFTPTGNFRRHHPPAGYVARPGRQCD